MTTTKSLREEINKFLEDDTEGEYDTHYQTNKILSMIEKRIDKRIRIVSKECNCGNSEVHENILNEYEHFRDLILK